jgi:hypothetical protein
MTRSKKMLLCVVVAVVGCAPSAPSNAPPNRMIGRIAVYPGQIMDYPLQVVEDSLNGVACYSLGANTLSCVKVR